LALVLAAMGVAVRPCLAAPGVSPGSRVPLAGEPIQPIPRVVDPDPARTAIGRRLFQDTRLSRNGRVSCQSCHDLGKGGADNRPRSRGVDGTSTEVSSPTVFNAALNFRQFWNGRAASLEARIDDVVRSPLEMGSSWDVVVARVAADAQYRQAFEAVYHGPVSQPGIQDALAAYERTLLTPDSRFDRYLRGESDALTPLEKDGYAAFKRFGCVACHQGVNVGGNMYQKFGVMGDYFADRGKPEKGDLGLFAVTGRAADLHVFKVPGLRNVVLNAPYFHDGSARTLGDAIEAMFKYQLGRIATPTDKTAIQAFLETLTGVPPVAR